MSESPPARGRIAVIGGGISGLAAALELRATGPNLDIVLFEASDRLGGIIRTDVVDGHIIEGGPDAFLGSKPGGMELTRALGLESRTVAPVPTERRSFVLRNGNLHPLPKGLSGLVPGEIRPLLTTSLLSPVGKARIFGDFVLPRSRSGADESLGSFVKRRVGRELYDHLMEPLLSGIYAGDGDRLSVAAVAPQFRAAEQQHGGLIRGAIATAREQRRRPDTSVRPGFVSFDTGMATLVDDAACAARERGCTIETGARCVALSRCAQGFELTVEQAGETNRHAFNGVILAVPGWAAAPLLVSIAEGASSALASMEFVSNALVAMAFPQDQLPRPIEGYGYIVPRIERRDVMAMTWLSSKWHGRSPAGSMLVRAFFGRAGREEILGRDDHGLIEATRAEMRDVLGVHVKPTLTRVYRIDRGMPQYNLGHLDRVQAVEASVGRIPGLQIAGSSLRGVGIPDCITSGQTAARQALNDLRLAGVLTS